MPHERLEEAAGRVLLEEVTDRRVRAALADSDDPSPRLPAEIGEGLREPVGLVHALDLVLPETCAGQCRREFPSVHPRQMTRFRNPWSTSHGMNGAVAPAGR